MMSAMFRDALDAFGIVTSVVPLFGLCAVFCTTKHSELSCSISFWSCPMALQHLGSFRGSQVCGRVYIRTLGMALPGFVIQIADEDDTSPDAVTTIYAPVTNLDRDSAPTPRDFVILRSWLITALRLIPLLNGIDLTPLTSTCSAAATGITIALEAYIKHRERRNPSLRG